MNDAVVPPLNNNIDALKQKSSLADKNDFQWVDLNQVLRQSLQKYAGQELKEQLILRIDPLPFVYCDASRHEEAFDELIKMIVQHPPLNSKLYLYVKCEEDANKNAGLSKKRCWYKISFYTNIVTDSNWLKTYRSQLLELSTVFSWDGAAFSFHEISNTGCLFSINLPGKIK